MIVTMLVAAALGIGLILLVLVIRAYIDGRSDEPNGLEDRNAPLHYWKLREDFAVEVLTTQSHLAAIESLRKESGGNRSINCIATLVPDGTGLLPYGGVGVSVFGRPVGLLMPGEARRFRRRLIKHGMAGKTTICSARICVNGGAAGQPLNYTVCLAIEPLSQ